MKVVVIMGGGSSERTISIESGNAIGQALAASGHAVTSFDPGDDTSFSMLRNFVQDADVVFPVLYGIGGEDGKIQAVLEALGVAFVGSSSMASRLCFDRALMLRTVHAAGIAAPVTDSVDFKHLKKHPLAQQPFVIKPTIKDTSGELYVVQNPNNFDRQVLKPPFERRGAMIMQQYIEGFTAVVTLVGDAPLPVVEIVREGNNPASTLCPPQHISAESQAKAQQTARAVHRLLGCRHISQTEFIVDAQGSAYVIGVNTVPDFSAKGTLMPAVTAAGVGLPAAADYLVRAAAKTAQASPGAI